MKINLLQKFYKGECSEEEVQEVVNSFASKEQKEALLEQLKADWDQFDVSEEETYTGYNPDKVLQGIHARLRQDSILAGDEHKEKSININRFFFLRVASIVILIIFSAFIIQTLISNPQLENDSYLVKEVPAGQRRTIMLEDGTKVILNAGSKLSYPEKFLKDKREIVLEGEAFFEVARDTSRPFIVASGEVFTTVLGTSFNIRAYQDEQNVQVAVASGKVKVNHGEENCYLLPGKAVNYDAEDNTLAVLDFKQEEVLSWKEGIIYFKDASFEEVVKTLERWYGVEIEAVGRGSQNWQYTGVFKLQSLENVLLSIGYVKHFNYKLKGNRVEIIFKNS